MPVAERCAAVLPCLNEAATIASITSALLARLPAVFVVDDGSTDETTDQAARAGARVIRLPNTGGKAAAVRTGIAAATAAGFEWAALLDGDGQHDIEDLPGLLATAETVGADLVIGNRMHDAQAIPWLRRTVNRWMSRDLSAWIGVEVPDSQSGYRLVNLRAWNRIRPGGEGFVLESAMTVAFATAGCRIASVPVRVLPRSRGRSRIRSLRDTVRWLRWRLTTRRLTEPRPAATAARQRHAD